MHVASPRPLPPALPATRSYAVKYIYAGPHEADLLSPDMCINILLTLMGFFPGGSPVLVHKVSALTHWHICTLGGEGCGRGGDQSDMA